MIDFLIDNICIKIGNHLFQQFIGIPTGTSCAPLLANLFLYSYEIWFLRSVKKSNKRLAKAFNLIPCYTDNLISINNPMFKQSLEDIYPDELLVSETSESRNAVILGFTDWHIKWWPCLLNVWQGGCIWFWYYQFSWLIWEHSNCPSLWYIHLTSDKIQSSLP